MSATAEGPVTEARRALLAQLLREAGELAAGEELTTVTQLEGGWSRWSHVGVVRAADGGERRYVVRVKAPHGLFDTDLIVEYELFVALQDLDLPVPRVFGLVREVDNPFGGEFFVMEFLTGRSANVWRGRDHQALRADWEGERGIARDVAHFAAVIHSVTPERLPASLPRMRFEDIVDHWRGAYTAAGLNRDPVLEEAFRWLEAHAPAPVEPRLVHGDYRIGNMLMEHGRVTAILDWELAYVGDPRFDLGYMATDYMAGKHLRPKTELLGAIADREWFLEEYERRSGTPLDREALTAFSVLGLVGLMSMTYTGLVHAMEGRTPDFRRMWARFGLPGMRQEVVQLMGW